MLTQGSHVRHHQVCAGLRRVLKTDVQTGLDAGAYHQAILAGEFFDGSLEGVQHLRHDRCNNAALDILSRNLINIQKDL